MKEMKLRPYQEQAKDAVIGEWDRGVKKTLLVLPTGTGKTIVFSKVIEDRDQKRPEGSCARPQG